jgi:flagellar hook-associated protein 1 FlgK
MLNVAVSGLRAFQRALETTSHNIANVSTPGYSRQRVDFATSQPEIFGSSAMGTGVVVQGVSRVNDELLSGQMRRASSGFTRLDAYAQKAGALNNLFADSSTGLSAALRRFTNALQGVANTPTSTAARQVLLSEAEGLVTRLQTYDTRLDDLEQEINAQLRGEAASINAIASNIARLNLDIARAQAQTGAAPGDLLDARDAQLADLASRIETSVVRQDDGQLNVFVGNGQALVLGNTSATLVAQQDPFQPSRATLAFKSANGIVDISSSLTGGSVGGLLDFRREMLDPARNQLGQMAVALADVANAQHREGMDLTGALGGNLFAVGGPVAVAATTNGSAVTATVTRTGVGALTANDYVLRYDGSAWQMTRADTGAPVAFTGSGSNASPIVAEGLSLVLSGTPVAGDRILVRPTAAAISGMDVLISDPAKLAAAAPIRTSSAAANTGSGTISAGEVQAAGNPQLRSTVTLRFTAGNAWEALDGAGNPLLDGGGNPVTGAYTPGGNIDINGWRVQIGGAPVAGDQFTVANNAAGTGDNRNALELASVLSQGVLNGGTESLDGAVTRFIGSIGVATAQANSSLAAQQIIYDDSVAAVESLSGVNLDEEAANMMRYQQAYQAAAQMIRVTQTIFDTLLEATRR